VSIFFAGARKPETVAHTIARRSVRTSTERPLPKQPPEAAPAKANGGDAEAPPRFRLISFEHLQPSTAPAYLIKGLFPRSGLVVVWCPPKCGKSFWTMDAMLHVSLGWRYRGHNTVKGPVVYRAFEGADGYGKRAASTFPENPIGNGMGSAFRRGRGRRPRRGSGQQRAVHEFVQILLLQRPLQNPVPNGLGVIGRNHAVVRPQREDERIGVGDLPAA
jgi:hypothetical protein